MKKALVFATLFVLGFTPVTGQETPEEHSAEPIQIDKELLSGIGLPKIKLKAHPEREFFQKRVHRGQELTVFLLSSETAKNTFENFPLEEFVYFMNGRADIRPSDSLGYSFYPGDYIVVPKGFKGDWTNNGGNRYHLELSVISNERSDSAVTSHRNKPFVLNRDVLAGTDITSIEIDPYVDELYAGVELEIKQVSEVPKEEAISFLEKEQFIHILSGKLVLTSLSGKEHIFYAGDFFILPKTFTGIWQSYGADLFRTLRVTQKG